MFYGIRYTKALQDILNTEGGRLAREMIQLSTPALAGKIETFSQRKGKWSKSSLAPQDAAVTSIALFGMELARGGQTPNERLAGSTLQMALIDYAKQNPSAQAACTAALAKWVEVRPHARQSTEPSSAATSAPAMNDGMDKTGLQYFAESAASFMAMQARWIQTMTDRPEFDGPTAAAFAYGAWNSVTQQLNLNNDDLLGSLILFASRWLDTQEKKSSTRLSTRCCILGMIRAIISPLLRAGGPFARGWLNRKATSFRSISANAWLWRRPKRARRDSGTSVQRSPPQNPPQRLRSWSVRRRRTYAARHRTRAQVVAVRRFRSRWTTRRCHVLAHRHCQAQ